MVLGFHAEEKYSYRAANAFAQISRMLHAACRTGERTRKSRAHAKKNAKKKGLILSNFLIRDVQILGKPLGVSHGFVTSLGTFKGFGHPC